MKRTSLVAAFALALSAAPVAKAAPTIFFGENTAPGETVSGSPETERDAFLSQLTGVGSEGFEGFALGTAPPIALAFPGSSGSITATLSGVGEVLDTTGVGRFNTTPAGANYFEVSGAFSIAFSSPVSAFGFYATDVGDFNGQLTIALTDTAAGVTDLIVANTVNGASGALLFWGFVDSATSYNLITFGNTQAGVDGFGFDDMVIGDRQQVAVPEPGTLVLLGLGFVGLVALRRRKTS